MQAKLAIQKYFGINTFRVSLCYIRIRYSGEAVVNKCWHIDIWGPGIGFIKEGIALPTLFGYSRHYHKTELTIFNKRRINKK